MNQQKFLAEAQRSQRDGRANCSAPLRELSDKPFDALDRHDLV